MTFAWRGTAVKVATYSGHKISFLTSGPRADILSHLNGPRTDK